VLVAEFQYKKNCKWQFLEFPGIPAGIFGSLNSREFPGIPEREFPVALRGTEAMPLRPINEMTVNLKKVEYHLPSVANGNVINKTNDWSCGTFNTLNVNDIAYTAKATIICFLLKLLFVPHTTASVRLSRA